MSASMLMLVHPTHLPVQILVRCVLRGHHKTISTLSISPDGRTLVSGGELNFVYVSFVLALTFLYYR